MTRIKVELPDNFIFSTEMEVRISDLNYGGHLGHDTLLTMMHEARVRFLNKHGFTELDIDGAGIIVSEAVINYKSQAQYGEVLKMEMAIVDIFKKGCSFIYKVTEKISGREVARAKIGVVFFDYKNRKILSLPQKFKELLTGA